MSERHIVKKITMYQVIDTEEESEDSIYRIIGMYEDKDMANYVAKGMNIVDKISR